MKSININLYPYYTIHLNEYIYMLHIDIFAHIYITYYIILNVCHYIR